MLIIKESNIFMQLLTQVPKFWDRKAAPHTLHPHPQNEVNIIIKLPSSYYEEAD